MVTIGLWGGFFFLQWNAIDFSRHAIQRMFERAIHPQKVRETMCETRSSRPAQTMNCYRACLSWDSLVVARSMLSLPETRKRETVT
jgi:hypothetical protein